MSGVVYLGTAFSLNMLEVTREGKYYLLYIKELTPNEVREVVKSAVDFVSAVGHESTARLLSELIGVEVKAERRRISLKSGDKLIVCQLTFRIPEGKVYDYKELMKLYDEGKVKLILVELR